MLRFLFITVIPNLCSLSYIQYNNDVNQICANVETLVYFRTDIITSPQGISQIFRQHNGHYCPTSEESNDSPNYSRKQHQVEYVRRLLPLVFSAVFT